MPMKRAPSLRRAALSPLTAFAVGVLALRRVLWSGLFGGTEQPWLDFQPVAEG